MKPQSVSIIICTCNRAESLRATLAALSGTDVPARLTCELIVVDNASTDSTREVVEACRMPHMPVRYIHEGRRGLSHARNAGLAASRGDIILFTDDDVRPARGWIAGMCAPILAGKAQAVAGGVRLAPHLMRPWMTVLHQYYFAGTGWINPEHPEGMVGANFAFSREVLAKVPGFDPELGAGQLGSYEESLFSWQIQEAGYTIAAALDVEVEHHFEVSRLTHAGFLKTAAGYGRSVAYFEHHWLHKKRDYIKNPYWCLVKCLLRLGKKRFLRRDTIRDPESCPEWEMQLVDELNYYQGYLIERRRPRNYKRKGLVKLSYPHPSQTMSSTAPQPVTVMEKN